ncbi:MAG: YggS family pyridoxal phosphate-dependent enzyme [Coriobacteriales bacterium]|nr:YggS family pyridoxal phosphate-dependent enzyme [Coriobacteriales bacterium]
MPEGWQEDAYLRFLTDRREELLGRIRDAAQRAGRDPGDITLLAVSKTVGMEEVRMAWQCGYTAFGENRPQELKRKADAASRDAALSMVRFDMIGNLQKNKINQVLDTATLIHSVSSTPLATAIASRACRRGVVARCLLEVNVSGEQTKSGFDPADVRVQAEGIAQMEGLRVEGLMTMAPARDEQAARRSFAGLRELRDELEQRMGTSLPVLSCGMSGDFQIAVEEGSTVVRLGRIVFDPAYNDK